MFPNNEKEIIKDLFINFKGDIQKVSDKIL